MTNLLAIYYKYPGYPGSAARIHRRYAEPNPHRAAPGAVHRGRLDAVAAQLASAQHAACPHRPGRACAHAGVSARQPAARARRTQRRTQRRMQEATREWRDSRLGARVSFAACWCCAVAGVQWLRPTVTARQVRKQQAFASRHQQVSFFKCPGQPRTSPRLHSAVPHSGGVRRLRNPGPPVPCRLGSCRTTAPAWLPAAMAAAVEPSAAAAAVLSQFLSRGARSRWLRSHLSATARADALRVGSPST